MNKREREKLMLGLQSVVRDLIDAGDELEKERDGFRAWFEASDLLRRRAEGERDSLRALARRREDGMLRHQKRADAAEAERDAWRDEVERSAIDGQALETTRARIRRLLADD